MAPRQQFPDTRFKSLPIRAVDHRRARAHNPVTARRIAVGANKTTGLPMSQMLQDLSTATAQIAAHIAPSLVALAGQRCRATGFMWKPGLIVTADDALPEEGDITATLSDGTLAMLTIAGRDPTTDIALLKLNASTGTAVTLAAQAPPLGALALALGHDGEGPVAAFGAVSVSRGGWRSMRGGQIDARIELDMRLRRAAEGGLAVDASGQVIGMTVFGPRRRVLVIPSATINRVAGKLEAHGRVARGYLGLGLQPVAVEGLSSGGDKAMGAMGAMVISVDVKGPGASAGLHQGDVLVSCDGQPITSVTTLLAALGPQSVGRAMSFAVRRGGAQHTVAIIIGERPAA